MSASNDPAMDAMVANDELERLRAENARLTDRLVALNGEYDVITGALALSDEKQDAMRPVIEAARAWHSEGQRLGFAEWMDATVQLRAAVAAYEAQQGEKHSNQCEPNDCRCALGNNWAPNPPVPPAVRPSSASMPEVGQSVALADVEKQLPARFPEALYIAERNEKIAYLRTLNDNQATYLSERDATIARLTAERDAALINLSLEVQACNLAQGAAATNHAEAKRLRAELNAAADALDEVLPLVVWLSHGTYTKFQSARDRARAAATEGA